MKDSLALKAYFLRGGDPARGSGLVQWVPASTAGRGGTKGKNDLWFDLAHGRKPGAINVAIFVLRCGR